MYVSEEVSAAMARAANNQRAKSDDYESGAKDVPVLPSCDQFGVSTC